MKPRILFFGKKGDVLCSRAAHYLQTHGGPMRIYLGSRKDPFPHLSNEKSWDFVLSYLSPWIIPAETLAQAKRAAINFHPAPPEYPGIGCTNFAIYYGAKSFGATCHHMAPRVDSGPIIRVARFPVYPEETVVSLTHRSYVALCGLFYEIADCLLKGIPLPTSEDHWTRKPFLRSDLDSLCRLTVNMSPIEVQRRIRATTFPGHPAASYPNDDAGGGA